jgi:hypothetical protein
VGEEGKRSSGPTWSTLFGPRGTSQCWIGPIVLLRVWQVWVRLGRSGCRAGDVKRFDGAEFFLKKDKKIIKFEKGCRLAKFRKMGTSRPINGQEAWGRGPPAHPTGGRSQNYFQAPPEGLFANKKTFLIREEAPETSRPPNGQEVPISLIFYYFLLEFMFYKLFKIYTFFKYKIYSCIHKF